MSKKKDSGGVVREIKRKTRRRFSAEEKIRIVLEGLKGEDTIAGLCRREGISPNLYYNWSKEFLEAGQQRLMGNTKRQAGETKSPIQAHKPRRGNHFQNGPG
jgi:transposase